MSSSPKPQPAPKDDKKPIYMANPYLDGLGIGAESSGRNSLRIDMGSPVPTPNMPRPVVRVPGGGGLGIGGLGGGSGGGGLGIAAGGGYGRSGLLAR